MIRSLYTEFGFFPTMTISLGMVILTILWIAGISGLIGNPERKDKASTFTLLLCLFVPPYPIIWLIYDVIRQQRRISGKKLTAE